jgi:ankyrin repeat protein
MMNMLMNKSRLTEAHQEKEQSNLKPAAMTASRAQPFVEGPMTLARLISMHSWHQVETILTSRPIELIEIDDRMAITQDNILHFACRFNAPLSIIKLLASKYTKSILIPDAIGRFPIHVACKYGASPLVIHFLICENFQAAGVPDDSGKAPIHYVAQYYARNHQTASTNENMLQVVRLFKASAPESFNLEDDEEYNAIEYALESNCDINVIKAMQRAARDDWRELKKKHNISHDEIKDGLEKTASENRKMLLGSIDEDVEMEICDKPALSEGKPVVSDSSVPLASRSYVAKTA